MKRCDLTGEEYGILKVIDGVIRIRGINKKEVLWTCLCKCGMITHVLGYDLKMGHTKSCGCLRQQSGVKSPSFKHGQRVNRTFTPEYRAWVNMKNRCENPKRKWAERYVGRGITYCTEWKDFTVFFRDMGKIPGNYYSLDRIDNNDGYSKENCRWATQRQQTQNTVRNIIFTFHNKSKCLSEWARIFNVTRKAIDYHYKKGDLSLYLTEQRRDFHEVL